LLFLSKFLVLPDLNCFQCT